MNTRFGLLFGAMVVATCGAASADPVAMPTDMDVVTVTAKTPAQALADAIVATAHESARPKTQALDMPELILDMPELIEAPVIPLEPIVASLPTAATIG